jgi:hypothetical protein
MDAAAAIDMPAMGLSTIDQTPPGANCCGWQAILKSRGDYERSVIGLLRGTLLATPTRFLHCGKRRFLT